MADALRFALNHMCAPRLDVESFLALAKRLGVSSVEIRNDLDGQAIVDGTPPGVIHRAASDAGVRVASINALQRFNEWNAGRAREAGDLIGYAGACGCEALVLVPTNDGGGRAADERRANLRIALKELAPRLEAAGLVGLIEPLGFESASLRFKSEAAEAIASVAGEGTFGLVHDTFHHHLAAERSLFPELTRLVHISGVGEARLATSDMRDRHRLLVERGDRLGTVEQIPELRRNGYKGLFSFEPFAPSVHELSDLEGALRASMALIAAEVEEGAV